MKKSFLTEMFRRVFLPAFFFSIFSASVAAQTYVSNNGIIMERVAEEDQNQAKRLNAEAEAENEIQSADSDSGSDFDSDSDSAAADVAETDDDIDALFGDEDGDTEDAVVTKTTETVKIDQKNKPIDFSGSLSAELGGYIWIYPAESTKPVATFSNTLKFTGRPSSDFFVTGSLLTTFPSMDIGIYELYFDYTMFGKADLSAGKRDISWSLSRMLDTNILDDELESISEDDAEEALKKKTRTTDDSKFAVALNVPILSYGSIQGIGFYNGGLDDPLSADYIEVAGKLEGSIGKFSLAVFGKRWASADANRLSPCAGLELVSTALGQNSNIFVQGLMHFAKTAENSAFDRARISTGIYKYFSSPLMLGLAFEYQAIWADSQSVNSGGDITQYKGWQHYFAAQAAWSHYIWTKKWTFGVEWYHDYRTDYGTILPVIKIENVVKYIDLRLGAPIYYGTTRKYGIVFEAILNLDY